MALNKPIICSNIILWRHAEATDASDEALQDDMARALTPKGQRQAKRMARWLKPHLPENTLLLSSAALRAFQTAQALNKSNSAKINVHSVLNPSANLPEVLAFLASFGAKSNLLLIGHQPLLGRLAGHLLGLESSDFNIKKGAIWWLRLESNPANLNQPLRYEIVSVQTPIFV
jgi:phosphohistidine phosphatase